MSALNLPFAWCHMPVGPEWMGVCLARPTEGTTATFGTLDNRWLYRLRQLLGFYVIERTAILAGEFTPHRIYRGDWGGFPECGDWQEVATIPYTDVDDPKAFDLALDRAMEDMVKEIASERGVEESDVRAEIAAIEERYMQENGD